MKIYLNPEVEEKAREEKLCMREKVSFESFHHVYNFIRRFIERSGKDIQTILFTVTEPDGEEIEVSEMENILELLERAIYVSLRRSDVSTRYSGKQMIVLLMDANRKDGEAVAARILECFHKLYTGKVEIDFGIAKMEGLNVVH